MDGIFYFHNMGLTIIDYFAAHFNVTITPILITYFYI